MEYNEFDEYCKTEEYCNKYKEIIRKMVRELTRPEYKYWIKNMYFKYEEKGKRKKKMVYDVTFVCVFDSIDGKQKSINHKSINFRDFDLDSLSRKISKIVNK